MDLIPNYPEIEPYFHSQDVLALWPNTGQRTSVNVLEVVAGSSRLSQRSCFASDEVNKLFQVGMRT
jgi:hypothetical protein